MNFKIFLTVLVGMVSSAPAAASTWCPDGSQSMGDYCYSVAADQAVITGYAGSGGDVVIPDRIDGFPVVKIDTNAFYN